MLRPSENNLFWQSQIEMYGRKSNRQKKEQLTLDPGKLKMLKWNRNTSFGSCSSDIGNIFDSSVAVVSKKVELSSSKRSENSNRITSNNTGFKRGSVNYGRSYGNRKTTQKSALANNVRDLYIPPTPLIGEALLEDRRKKSHRTGINFSAYENIPVEALQPSVQNFWRAVYRNALFGNSARRLEGLTFDDLKLHPLVLENVTRAGYKKPTPIQKNASPYIIAGRDIMACAQTGSGKTAAYLLPIMSNLKRKGYSPASSKGPQCLILSPTRELALQIQTEANLYSNKTGLKNCSIFGGVAIYHQKLLLKRGCNLLVATPGRLLQFLEERILNMDCVEYLVLDEADRMLDLGFMGTVREILKYLPPKNQRISVMLSATFPGGVQRAASEFLNNYTFISIGIVGAACQDIQQVVYKVDRYDKTNKLLDVMREIELDEKIIIFCERKVSSVHLTTALSNFGFSATTLNGDMLQRERELALKEFCDGKYQILVTTGVASRGLDVARVSLVINYDLPENIEEYIHRIGRTGRIGNIGKAISFFQDIVDDPLRSQLECTLRNAGQEVPEWMPGDYDLEETSLYGSKFPATDFRRNLQGFPWSSVPAAVEVDEDGWG